MLEEAPDFKGVAVREVREFEKEAVGNEITGEQSLGYLRLIGSLVFCMA